MEKMTLWMTGHPIYQCRNTHVEECAAYDVETLQEAYCDVVNQYSEHWFKYPQANPPYVEHKTMGWKLFFYPTREEAEATTYSLWGKYPS